MAKNRNLKARAFEELIALFEAEMERRGQALGQEMQNTDIQSDDLGQLAKDFEFAFDKMRLILNVEKSFAERNARVEEDAGFDFETAREEILERISRRLS